MAKYVAIDLGDFTSDDTGEGTPVDVSGLEGITVGLGGDVDGLDGDLMVSFDGIVFQLHANFTDESTSFFSTLPANVKSVRFDLTDLDTDKTLKVRGGGSDPNLLS